MQVLDLVSVVLKDKGRTIWSIAPEATVYEALMMMATHEIGSLLVKKENAIVVSPGTTADLEKRSERVTPGWRHRPGRLMSRHGRAVPRLR